MNVVKTYIGPSKIEGLGMFADEFIPKGSLIWRIDGLDRVFSEEEVYKLGLNFVQRIHFAKYSYKHKDKYIYCSDENRFCNHSEDPNTMSDYKTQVAIADIKKGEEITCNYKEFDDEFETYKL